MRDQGHGGDDQDLHPETVRLMSRRQMLGTTGKAAALTLFGVFTVACSSSTTSETGATTTAKAASTSTTARASATTGTAKPGSLYTRLGGNTAITAVVGTFLQNVVADQRINHFFAKTDANRLQVLLVEQIGEATGGPEKYSGKDMTTAHAGMAITVADFNALVEDLVKALDQYQVPTAEKQELLNALAPMQTQIVTA
ncbi:MAG: group 1 truncated hemoglobin [Acidimicrobiales bacterium]